MILLIAGTNRPDSKTDIFTRNYASILENLTDEKIEILYLSKIQKGLFHKMMYEESEQGETLRQAQNDLFIPADKWIILSPEYNGSYPGALKLLMDALSVRNADRTFHNKKVALVGVSSGRTGNWLGMNQLTAVLNYLKMDVFHNKLAISHISDKVDDTDTLTDDKTKTFMREQAIGFLQF